MRNGMDITRPAILTIESEEKNPLEVGDRLVRTVNGKRPRIGTEWSKVIEAENVIGVRMREDYRVDATNVLAQALRTEVRSGIDDEGDLRSLDVNRRTAPVVAGIGGMADGTIATDDGHALRCARPEKCDREVCR